MTTNSKKPDFLNIKKIHEYEPRKMGKYVDESRKKHLNSDGQLHREDGPALIDVNPDTGEVLAEAWYLNGKPHRENNPAYVSYDGGKIISEQWWLNGELHREGKPAMTALSYNRDEIIHQEWWLNGKRHRDGRPAVIKFVNLYPDGDYEKYVTVDSLPWVAKLLAVNGSAPFSPEERNVWEEQWYQNGRLHREDAPAFHIYNKKTKKPYVEKWYRNGKLHRENGAAWIIYDIDTNTILEERFYIKGRKPKT